MRSRLSVLFHKLSAAHLVLILFMAAGCTTPLTPGEGNGDTNITSNKASNVTAPGNMPDNEAGYRTVPFDVININVYAEPDISGDYEISNDGFITHHLLGKVNLEGLNKDQIRNKIAGQLKDGFLVNPRVKVNIISCTGRFVRLIGHFNKKGIISFAPGEPMTLMQAITKAGGFSSKANHSVQITHIAEQKEETVKIKYILRGDKKDIPLKPGDIIKALEIII